MQIYQQRIFPFSRKMVYNTLRDTKQLEEILPLVTAIEETQANQYQVQATLVAGPIRGNLRASLTIEQEQAPENFQAVIHYTHLLGNIVGEFAIQFDSLAEKRTKVTIKGPIKMTRLLKVAAYKIQPATIDHLMNMLFEDINYALKRQERAAVEIAA